MGVVTEARLAGGEDSLDRIEQLDGLLAGEFSASLVVDKNLERRMVSFQANKQRSYYKWYKFKEAFSASLVEYLFCKYSVQEGKVLDPFAGSGTALFAAASLGYDAEGIELLPIGQKIIEANILARGDSRPAIVAALGRWLERKPWNEAGEATAFQILRITDGAYPPETHRKIGRYLASLETEPPAERATLLFALLCILEAVSYTRKDGQYLRWDHRSGRCWGKKQFNKGEISPFEAAITGKLQELQADITQAEQASDLLSAPSQPADRGSVNLIGGSCLDMLPQLEAGAYSGVITSPPYCNRYDYTRTYALELALLGVGEVELARLRQEMLSCTVENRTKYLLAQSPSWQAAIDICDQLPLLQEILAYLDRKRAAGELNNNGIARMVRGYFYEMACVIHECHRVLASDGIMIMVNDNVRYAGASISVDTILSRIAEQLGFAVANILVLPQRKGNSSQQMGKHGREALRKCVYIWRKH